MSLLDTNTDKLLEVLGSFPGLEFRINAKLGSSEAESLSYELSKILNRAGWSTGVDFGFYDRSLDPAFKGIIISYLDEIIPASVNMLNDWLIENGFNSVLTQEYNGKYNEIIILP